MGFLNKSEVRDIEKDEFERKMAEWRHNYPLAAAVMSDTKFTPDQGIYLIKLGQERRYD